MPNIITRVTAESSYKLPLVYSDGSEIIINFKPVIEQGRVFAPLSDLKLLSCLVKCS